MKEKKVRILWISVHWSLLFSVGTLIACQTFFKMSSNNRFSLLQTRPSHKRNEGKKGTNRQLPNDSSCGSVRKEKERLTAAIQ